MCPVTGREGRPRHVRIDTQRHRLVPSGIDQGGFALERSRRYAAMASRARSVAASVAARSSSLCAAEQ